MTVTGDQLFFFVFVPLEFALFVALFFAEKKYGAPTKEPKP